MDFFSHWSRINDCLTANIEFLPLPDLDFEVLTEFVLKC